MSAQSTFRHHVSSRHWASVGAAGVLVASLVAALEGTAEAVNEGDNCIGGVQTMCTYSYKPQKQDFVVPEGVSSITVELQGGSGGSGAGADPQPGGAGGLTTATLTVTPLQVIDIYVGNDGGTGECDDPGAPGGDSGGLPSGGNGGDGGGNTCPGGGGGGATYLMAEGEQPGAGTPLAAAGGGGGGGGGPAAAAAGGKGGNHAAAPASGSGSGGGEGGGAVGVVGQTGEQGNLNDGGGGGGGGGGYPRGGARGLGGSDVGGGGGGCGFVAGNPPQNPCGGGMGNTVMPAASYRPTAEGVVTIFYSGQGPTGPGTGAPPPAVPSDSTPEGGSHPSSNDPNPNTNPNVKPKLPPGMDPSTTATAVCRAQQKHCSVSPPAGPDSSFRIDAADGNERAALFATMNGNWRPASVEASGRPNCPNYTEQNTDWVQFGFLNAKRGRSWHKTGYMTQRHSMTKAKATAMSKKLQICFAAPYTFPTRAGYGLAHNGPDWMGVLPDCGSARSKKAKPAQRPCVVGREVIKVKGGWTVQVVFRVPASAEDPKALG